MNSGVMSARGVMDRIGGEFGVGDIYVNKYKMFHSLSSPFSSYNSTPGRVVTY